MPVKKIIVLLIILLPALIGAEILIPMDFTQSNHLKAYGVAFEALKEQYVVKWFLNYRGGSFLMPESESLAALCNIRGVRFELVSSAQVAAIMQEIQESNMEVVVLEKEPKIAVYIPPNALPWDDAVTLALDYAEIDYDRVWDDEVLAGKLSDYDWLHLHHEDFTGQYGKFYGAYRNTAWYQNDVRVNEAMAAKHGYAKVWQLKHAVAEKIREFVMNGGFLFAMCAATDTLDIALAAHNVDIVDALIDGDGIDPHYQEKLDYSRCFAFENFKLKTNPYEYEFSDIDASDYSRLRGPEADYFQLFDFSAKYDPVPTMLTQCHTNIIPGFLGQTTSFFKDKVKKSVIILAEVPGQNEVKYIHGNFGKGTFTFYGGHDPEDYEHKIGDPPTILDLYKNSPGYRLILNNILFPAAEKKQLKT
ncbi:MAG TPA: asparagine synthetase B [Candidatus Syntrophosphaera thermopropionivorans]|nr:asparagine synthetase B [Candidatus Syntrophosphaera thermopropionivorans]HQH47940.1 asparagine synthetase B [Candidatus Syntrophosphaera thermopropionivorans]HQK57260.1 asparagine synthetase B [Candidatus Syntrophosphaera thermopropionivorans]HRR98361.1 asparagine synthetase B [Candidatus Syntrophosphaera sp.]